MHYLVILLAAVLFVVVAGCLFMAFGVMAGSNIPAGAPWPPLRERFSWRWMAGALACAVAMVALFPLAVFPMSERELTAEVQDFARSTFREKLGKEPQELKLTHVMAEGEYEDWRFTGTGQLDGKSWDVLVTRSSHKVAGKAVGEVKTECTLTPRPK